MPELYLTIPSKSLPTHHSWPASYLTRINISSVVKTASLSNSNHPIQRLIWISCFLASLLHDKCFMRASSLACSFTVKMEETCFSDTSVDFQRTTRRYIPGDSTLNEKLVCILIYYKKLEHKKNCHNLNLPLLIEASTFWLTRSPPTTVNQVLMPEAILLDQ
jgi:hypothetical protein